MSTLFGYEVVEQAHEIDRLSTEIASLSGENERLREACRLFVEYDDHNEGSAITLILLYNAAITATRAALQPNEEK